MPVRWQSQNFAIATKVNAMLISMDTSIHNARTQKLIRCNECKQVLRVDQAKEHFYGCKQLQNKRKLKKLVVERDGLLLHAIACARYHAPEDYRLEIHYVHAEDINHARAQFCHAHPNRERAQILAVGLSIGWLANEQEKILVH